MRAVPYFTLQRLFWVILTLVASSIIFSGRLAAQSAELADGLLITEVAANVVGDDAALEWVEVANLTSAEIDLSQIKLGDEESASGSEGMARFPRGATIAPGQVIVVAQSAAAYRLRFGTNPDYEWTDSDSAVADMRPFPLWATGSVGFANDGDEVLLLNQQNSLIDGLSYGDSTAVFAPAVDAAFEGQSLARIPAHCDSDSAVDWVPQRPPTPGEVDLEGECRAPSISAEIEPEAALPVSAVQGEGDVAPLVNQDVVVAGVVTAVVSDQNAAGVTFHTLFVQDSAAQADGDPTTSDGVAVFLGREQPFVEVGDRVRVHGRVTEFFGLTEIESSGDQIQIEGGGESLPEPILVDPPADNADQLAYFEPLEGMRVRLAGDVRVVGATHTGCGLAVMTSAETDPIFQRQESDPIGQIVPLLHISDVACGDFPQVKTGDTLGNVVGVLTYHFDQFKIVVDGADLVVSAEPLPTVAPPLTAADDSFTLATFNLENHFDSHDDTGLEAEPKPSAEAIARKQTKLAHALRATLGCPTLVGVQEVEHAALLTELAQISAEACGFVYQVSHLESADARGIDVALLSDPRRVVVENVTLAQGCTPIDTGIDDPSITCPDGESPLFSRPPLRVEARIGEQPITLLVNHFKSKRGDTVDTAARRLAQAEYVGAISAELLAQHPDAWVAVLGDFNDYDGSPALRRLQEAGGLVSALDGVVSAERYSFVFGGAAQLIDGIYVSPALAQALDAAMIQHTNADFPIGMADDLSAEGLPFRATDHDLPLVRFSLPPDLVTPMAATAAPTSALEMDETQRGGISAEVGLVVAIVVFSIVGIGFLIFARKLHGVS